MKDWYSSKTILFNILSVIAIVLASPNFLALLPDTAMSLVVTVSGIVNIALRMVTNTAIAGSGVSAGSAPPQAPG